MPVLEVRMAAIPEARWRSQLVLFDGQPVVPRWSDLSAQTRVEVVSLLAQLLISTRPGSLDCAPQEKGGRDE
jgi:hypothetical protein